MSKELKIVAGLEFDTDIELGREATWILESLTRSEKGYIYYEKTKGESHKEITELRKASEYGYFFVVEDEKYVVVIADYEDDKSCIRVYG